MNRRFVSIQDRHHGCAQTEDRATKTGKHKEGITHTTTTTVPMYPRVLFCTAYLRTLETLLPFGRPPFKTARPTVQSGLVDHLEIVLGHFHETNTTHSPRTALQPRRGNNTTVNHVQGRGPWPSGCRLRVESRRAGAGSIKGQPWRQHALAFLCSSLSLANLPSTVSRLSFLAALIRCRLHSFILSLFFFF